MMDVLSGLPGSVAGAGRRVLETSLLRRPAMALLPPLIMRRPVDRWPAALGVLTGVRVPRCVVPNRHPAPTGGAHPAILLEMLERTSEVDGAIVECGVYLGETLLLMAIAVRQLGRTKRVIGIDTFEGFGEEIHFDIALGGDPSDQRSVGAFADASYGHLCERINSLNLGETVELRKGYFIDAFKKLREEQYSFVHLDCDLYSSYREALEYFYPRLPPGGIVLLDEYNDPPWPGCNLAVDEFLADRPEELELIERNNFQKWYFVKGDSESAADLPVDL